MNNISRDKLTLKNINQNESQGEIGREFFSLTAADFRNSQLTDREVKNKIKSKNPRYLN
jgi:hypothetical protein